LFSVAKVSFSDFQVTYLLFILTEQLAIFNLVCSTGFVVVVILKIRFHISMSGVIFNIDIFQLSCVVNDTMLVYQVGNGLVYSAISQAVPLCVFIGLVIYENVDELYEAKKCH